MCRKARSVSSEPQEVGGAVLRAADDDPIAADEEGALHEAGVLEEEKKYREALQLLEKCQKRTPDFRDVKDRIRALRDRVAREGKTSAPRS